MAGLKKSGENVILKELRINKKNFPGYNIYRYLYY